MKLKIAFILIIFIHFALTDQEDSFAKKHNNLLKWLNFFNDYDTPAETTTTEAPPFPEIQAAKPVQGNPGRQGQSLSFGVPGGRQPTNGHPVPMMFNPVPTMPNPVPTMTINRNPSPSERDGGSRDGQSILNAQLESGPQSLHAYHQPQGTKRTPDWYKFGYYRLQAPNSLLHDYAQCSNDKLEELIGQKVSDLPKMGNLPGYRCYTSDWKNSGTCVIASCTQVRFCGTKGSEIKGRCKDPRGDYTKLCCI